MEILLEMMIFHDLVSMLSPQITYPCVWIIFDIVQIAQ